MMVSNDDPNSLCLVQVLPTSFKNNVGVHCMLQQVYGILFSFFSPLMDSSLNSGPQKCVHTLNHFY